MLSWIFDKIKIAVFKQVAAYQSDWKSSVTAETLETVHATTVTKVGYDRQMAETGEWQIEDDPGEASMSKHKPPILPSRADELVFSKTTDTGYYQSQTNNVEHISGIAKQIPRPYSNLRRIQTVGHLDNGHLNNMEDAIKRRSQAYDSCCGSTIKSLAVKLPPDLFKENVEEIHKGPIEDIQQNIAAFRYNTLAAPAYNEPFKEHETYMDRNLTCVQPFKMRYQNPSGNTVHRTIGTAKPLPPYAQSIDLRVDLLSRPMEPFDTEVDHFVPNSLDSHHISESTCAPRIHRKNYFHSVPVLKTATFLDNNPSLFHEGAQIGSSLNRVTDSIDTLNFSEPVDNDNQRTKYENNSQYIVEDKENREGIGLRPVYLIHPHQHVFGCASYDDEDPDEFFISSGVVRASCPNIYEVSDPAVHHGSGCGYESVFNQNWHSCIELEFVRDDETCEMKSYLTDNYDVQVRNAKRHSKNSEISSTTTSFDDGAARCCGANANQFRLDCGSYFCPVSGNGGADSCNSAAMIKDKNHYSNALSGLPPLRLPYYSCCSSSRDGSDIDMRNASYGSVKANVGCTTRALSLIVLGCTASHSADSGFWHRKLSWKGQMKWKAKRNCSSPYKPFESYTTIPHIGGARRINNQFHDGNYRSVKCTSELGYCSASQAKRLKRNCFVR